MATVLAREAIGDGLVAEIHENGVLWISKAAGERFLMLADEAPMNLLTFLTKNRNLLRAGGRSERELDAEEER
jgi:hypothetical protein